MSQVAKKEFRPEIQGLRAIAALLVAIYHIWLGRVSGAVDVFFVVSGYLVIGSLLRQLERTGRIDFARFWGNLSKRLLPIALLVIVFVLIASLFLLPQVRWAETAQELIAATLYYENWQLAWNAVDYLARDNAASPVQHYWALSLQGQYYLAWPLIITVVGVLQRRSGWSLRHTMTGTLLLLIGVSLTWSVYITAKNQPFAYFDTGARAWEFAMGGLLALWLPKIRLTTRWYALLGWLGVAAIISCGLILKVSTVFPGYAALWPTLAVCLVLVAGTQGGRFGAHRLLASRPLMQLGDVSYALYLWHWPILMFWLLYRNVDQAGLVDGLLVLAISVFLAYITTRWVETPVRSSGIGVHRPKQALLLGAGMLAPVLAALFAWTLHIEQGQAALAQQAENPAYPGAMARWPGFPMPVVDVPILPAALQAKADLPSTYASRCHQMPRNPEVLSCSFGPDDANVTVALVGGSHSAHWLPALQRLANEKNIQIINFTKSACRFSASTRGNASCPIWNARLLEELSERQPDLVITTATLGVGSKERVPADYVKQWRLAEDLGIRILAIRDNPRPGFDVPECVERYSADGLECDVQRDAVLNRANPLTTVEKLPLNVQFADYSDVFCDAERCPVTMGNVLVYRDAHHLTATFSRTMAPMLWEDIERLLPH